MKIFITGCTGYIGSALGPYLMERGHTVSGIDAGFYAAPLLFSEPASRPAVRKADKIGRASCRERV